MKHLAALLVVFVLFTLGGCALQRRAMLNATTGFCEVDQMTEAETGLRSTFVWHVSCRDGRQLRCGGNAVYGSGIQNVHCEPETPSETSPAAPAPVGVSVDEPAPPPVATPAPVTTPEPLPAPEPVPAPPASPCDGIACSGHGRCVVAAGAPVCACEAGYAPDAAQVNCLAQQ